MHHATLVFIMTVSFGGPFWPCMEVDKPALKTTVHREPFEDFAKNSFQVTINRVQQLALQKIGGKLPTPQEQLDMVNKRREAKKSRPGSANHSSIELVTDVKGIVSIKLISFNGHGVG